MKYIANYIIYIYLYNLYVYVYVVMCIAIYSYITLKCAKYIILFDITCYL